MRKDRKYQEEQLVRRLQVTNIPPGEETATLRQDLKKI
jgi:hypothetical protein